MTITVRIDTAPAGESDLVETLRMAIGLALGDAALHVVFTEAGRRWWAATRDRDAALRRRLDDLCEALQAIGAIVVGLAGEGGEGRHRITEQVAASDLLINSVGPCAA
jgi:hypothetical protein